MRRGGGIVSLEQVATKLDAIQITTNETANLTKQVRAELAFARLKEDLEGIENKMTAVRRKFELPRDQTAADLTVELNGWVGDRANYIMPRFIDLFSLAGVALIGAGSALGQTMLVLAGVAILLIKGFMIYRTMQANELRPEWEEKMSQHSAAIKALMPLEHAFHEKAAELQKYRAILDE